MSRRFSLAPRSRTVCNAKLDRLESPTLPSSFLSSCPVTPPPRAYLSVLKELDELGRHHPPNKPPLFLARRLR